MKKFKDIKVGDRIYSASIMNSVIQQDCVGGIIVDYYVSNAMKFSGENAKHMTINLEKMRYMYKEGYVKDDRPESSVNGIIIYPNMEETSLVNALVEKENNRYGLLINKRVFSTTKRGVFNELSNILNSNSKKVDDVLEETKKAKAKTISMNILFANSLRMTKLEPEEEEKEVTEEEFASMAL